GVGQELAPDSLTLDLSPEALAQVALSDRGQDPDRFEARSRDVFGNLIQGLDAAPPRSMHRSESCALLRLAVADGARDSPELASQTLIELHNVVKGLGDFAIDTC